MIKAIIFDYNGVITLHGGFESFLVQKAEKAGGDATKIQRIVRQHWDLARVGTIDSKLVWKKAADYLGCGLEELRREWISWFELRKDLLLLIKQLKTKYKTALLTNLTQEWFEQVKQEQPDDLLPATLSSDYFQVIVSSYEVRAAKPDPAIFNYTLRRLGLPAQECIFVDDQEKNTSAAAKLGFKVILFQSTEKLKVQLVELGISV